MALLEAKGVDVTALQLPKKWCVYAKQSLHSIKVVLRYLARYTRKGIMKALCRSRDCCPIRKNRCALDIKTIETTSAK